MNPEELRARALEALGVHADPGAREALERGELVIVAGGTSWQGERGTVTGARVGLGLTPDDLARFGAAHATVDAIVAAVATAIGATRLEPSAAGSRLALTDLVLFWSPAARAPTALYRGAQGSLDLGAAVVRYLRAKGQHEAADFACTARFTRRGDEVAVHPFPAAGILEQLESAVRALLAHSTSARLRLGREGAKSRR